MKWVLHSIVTPMATEKMSILETEGGVHTVTTMETRMNSSRMRTDCGSNHPGGGGGF